MSIKKNKKGFIFIDFDETLIDRYFSTDTDTNIINITKEDFIKNYYTGKNDEEKTNKFNKILNELIKLKESGYHLYVLSRNEKYELRDIINRIFVIEGKKEEIDTIINESIFDDIILNDDLQKITLNIEEKKVLAKFYEINFKQLQPRHYASMKKCKKIDDIRSDSSPFILIDDTLDNIKFFNFTFSLDFGGYHYQKEKKYLDDVLKEIVKIMEKNNISKKRGII